MIQEFNKIDKIQGELELPGDKSISHRAVMFSSMAGGVSKIYNLSNGEDVKSTQKCFKQLGTEITLERNYVKIQGNGFKGFKKPEKPLDAGNSGTTTRLMSGILMAQDFESTIIGDSSLSRRPMKRIITPLTAMGGKISASENYTLPLTILPAEEILQINYELPVASAQVKSAVLLAGLYSDKISSVIENLPSRNHTEKMLGLKTRYKNSKNIIFVSKEDYPEPKVYHVPSDISTAAFFIILTLLTENSSLTIKDVSLNKTRTGIIDVLKQMGGKIEIKNIKEIAGEEFGDISISSSTLNNIEIKPEIIPNIIDEIPILTIAGIFAEGDFEIRNAQELRAKETDRISAICSNLKLLGLNVEETNDGFAVNGNIEKKSPIFESYQDHRIAMAFGVLSFMLKEGGKVNNFDCVNISNPDFITQMEKIIR